MKGTQARAPRAKKEKQAVKRIKLTVAYDGTNYVGWQIQKNGLAVEQVLNERLSDLLEEDIKVIGASRTDSGVHATGNVAVFDTDTRIPPEKIALALNQRLPDDIKIAASCEVPPDFHPRHISCKKTYEYRILNCRYNLPTLRLYSDYVYYRLDTDKMKEGAAFLIGEHDFTAFSSAGGQQKSPVRTIYSIDIFEEFLEPDPGADARDEYGFGFARDNTGCARRMDPAARDEHGFRFSRDNTDCARRMDPDARDERGFRPKIVTIRIAGGGFLYNMVRIIAGTLEAVGMGIYPPEHVKTILESLDRSKSAPMAPARGLTLVGIEFGPEAGSDFAPGNRFCMNTEHSD